MTASPDDRRFMQLALDLARRAAGRTSPNPLVGAVLVNRLGEVVGRGYHRRAGCPHAEVEALREAGDLARDADLYVNLEPCNHHGRTGPCARAIVEAGVHRVVVGMTDPNPLVNGQGINMLREAGVEVELGVLGRECRQLNRAFVCSIQRKRPLVLFKSAVTLDGRVATSTGDARWVTGAAARQWSHQMRNELDAIMVGVGTVLADNPSLSCRDVDGGRDPLRVVIDSALRTPPTAKVVALGRTSPAATVIYTLAGDSTRRARALTQAGAVVVSLPADGQTPHPPLPAVLADLLARHVTSLLLEGGPRLAGSFWDQGLVDRVVAFVAPKILGDPAALPMVAGMPVGRMANAIQLVDIKTEMVGCDIMIAGDVRRDESAAEGA